MPPSQTPQQLIETMTQAGLVPEDKAKQLASKVTENTQVNTITNALVSRGVLTELQEKLLLGEVDGSLLMGEYRLEEKIGSGGMGTVFKARHRVMDRPVALKVLAPEMTQNPQQVQRFMREIKLVGKLQHANIVMAYDASEHEGIYYLVMELVEGQDLNSIVKDRGPMQVLKSMELIAQAADGFAYAHEKGIVHRDIKPANLLLTNEGVVKILDLGIARLLGDASLTTQDGGTTNDEMTLTSTGHLLGTVPYMAPEHAANPKDADHRSDIYSLGCTLYWLITGAFPYGGTTAVEMILASYRQPVPDVTERFEIPGKYMTGMRELQSVLSKMLAKKPDNRYQAMASVSRDLRQLLADYKKQLSGYKLVTQVPGQSDLMTQTMSLDQQGKAGTMPNRTLLDDLMSDTALERTPRWQLWLKKPLAIIAGGGVLALVILALLIFKLSGNVNEDKEPEIRVIIKDGAESKDGAEGQNKGADGGGESIEKDDKSGQPQTLAHVAVNTNGAHEQGGKSPDSDSVVMKQPGGLPDGQPDIPENSGVSGVSGVSGILVPGAKETPGVYAPPLPPAQKPELPASTNVAGETVLSLPGFTPAYRYELVEIVKGPIESAKAFTGVARGKWGIRPSGLVPPGPQLYTTESPATLQFRGQLPFTYRSVISMQYRDSKKDVEKHEVGDYALRFRFLNPYGLLELTVDQREESGFRTTFKMLDPVTGELRSTSGIAKQSSPQFNYKTEAVYRGPVFSHKAALDIGTTFVVDMHAAHSKLFWAGHEILGISFPTTDLVDEKVLAREVAVEVDALVPVKINKFRMVTFPQGSLMPKPPPF